MHAAHFALLQNVAPKAGTVQDSTPAPAGTPAAPQGAPPNPLISFFPFLLLVPLLFMMFRRQKREQQERANLKKGDRVATQAGLIGELMEIGEGTSKVKIAAGVTVEVLTSSLQSYVPPAAKKDDLKAADSKIAADKK